MSVLNQKSDRLIGSVFTRWTVVEYDCVINSHKYYKCRCVCGVESSVRKSALISGKSKSCGCLKVLAGIVNNTTHGMTLTSEYKIWRGLRSRCLDINDKSYHYYGGRGIGVCDDWVDSFDAFYKDMGNRPSKYHSIDRIDNNGDYSKDNCRWATAQVQANNKRNTNKIHYNGVVYSISELSKLTGINRNTLSKWIRNLGLTPDECIDRNNNLIKNRKIF